MIKKLITKVTAFFDRTIGLLAFLARIIVCLMMLGVTTEVITRYFLHRPITGVIEVTEVMILWIVFLGAAWLLREDGHVRMEIVVSRLKPAVQTSLNIITSIISAIICLILVRYGAEVTMKVLQDGTRQEGLIGIPTSIVIIIIPLGSLLLFIQYVRRAYGYWKGTQKTTVTDL